jgi:hypothetical protein
MMQHSPCHLIDVLGIQQNILQLSDILGTWHVTICQLIQDDQQLVSRGA